ncbi:MAG TPA: tetratricopeptide repeat protein [Fimbriiglobus sp.]|jgi:outer membrane protein assembly factor BamD (BamD/ComL family)
MTVARVPFALACLFGLAAVGCGSFRDFKDRMEETGRTFTGSSYKDPEAELKMTKAEQFYQDGQFDDARRIFARLAENTRNAVLTAEKARFMEAECLREEKKLPEAVDTYHRMLKDFPAGAYRVKACKEIFDIANYWLDDTRAAIERQQKGESKWKLPKMPDWSDPTKPRVDQEGEALQALEYVYTYDMTGPVADQAMYWAGYVNFVRGNYEEADHCLSMLVEFHKNSPLRPKAVELAIMAKNNSTGGPDYDGTKCAEAMQLVHTAEVSMPEFSGEEKSQYLLRQKMAIRMQQAESDFHTAEYYERTGHPGSAVYTYLIVQRRFPGTKYSDLAEIRIGKLKEEAAKEKAAPTGNLLTRTWEQMTGGPREIPSRAPETVVPASGTVPQSPPSASTVGTSVK